MRRNLLFIALFFGLGCLSATQGLAEAFSFAVSAPSLGYSTTGTFTATFMGNGSYRVTDATGSDVLGLISAGGLNGNDNLLLPSSQATVDSQGVAISLLYGTDTYEVDMFTSGSTYYGLVLTPQGYSTVVPISLTLQQIPMNMAQAATPEPNSLILLGLGMMTTALFALKRAAAKSQPGLVEGDSPCRP